MSNYLLLYQGGSRSEDPAVQEKAMQAWTNWFGQLGSSLVDGGNPASQAREISTNGSVSQLNGSHPTGYSIIKSNDIDGAVALAKGCPIFADGGSLQVVETVDAM